MYRDDILASLQFAINSITAATAGVCSVNTLPEDIEDEMTVSIKTDQGETNILIRKDGTIIIMPSQSGIRSYKFPQYGPHMAEMRGKPKNLPARRCPTCKGKGSI